MRLDEFKQKLKTPPKKYTLCFLIDGNKVLLGKKKRGMGKGKWLGFGGKVEAGETVDEAAIRETLEEACVTPLDITRAGILDFYFPSSDDPRLCNQRVFVYTAKEWAGDITESEEMFPRWFDFSEIPFGLMWSDGRFWLHEVLDGQKISAEFMFDEDMEVFEYNILPLSKDLEFK